MEHNNHINYLEFKAKNLDHIKLFYGTVFGWTFRDYGVNYVAFEDSGLSGGFEFSQDAVVNGALVVLYHSDLEQIQKKVEAAGGIITQEIFAFPGGRRFHFKDPSGNELAIWSET